MDQKYYSSTNYQPQKIVININNQSTIQVIQSSRSSRPNASHARMPRPSRSFLPILFFSA